MLALKSDDLLRFSLVFVWLATALVSVLEFHGKSAQLLARAPGLSASLACALILAGAAADAVLGFALWLRPTRRVYHLALALMVLLTIVATLIEPRWWLNPLGPLTKNVPIAAILLFLARRPM